jgi:aspartate carbamoyltransferase catalytic subunit
MMTETCLERLRPSAVMPRHLVTVRDVEWTDVERWIQRAEALREMRPADRQEILRGSVVATLFYEPSTRTRLSFEAAVYRLGGAVVSAENARDNSSARKGERLEDVLRVVGSYADAIVIRHHEAETLVQAAPVSPVPVISAGAGDGEHPTQALLDVYTIYRELGTVDGLNVTVVGDLRYGRTVHSLLLLLAKCRNVQITLCHPPSLGLPAELYRELSAAGMRLWQVDNVDEALVDADVVYQTRIQTERLANADELRGADRFHITADTLRHLKETARILHPLPRVSEIHPDVDQDPRAAYFRQAENGLYMRMALLEDRIRGGVQ